MCLYNRHCALNHLIQAKDVVQLKLGTKRNFFERTASTSEMYKYMHKITSDFNETEEVQCENKQCGLQFVVPCLYVVHVCRLVTRVLEWNKLKLLYLGNIYPSSPLYKLPKCILLHIISFIRFGVELEKCDVDLEDVGTIKAMSGARTPRSAQMMAQHGNIVDAILELEF